MRIGRARLADAFAALIGLASTFLAFGVALIFGYGIYSYFQWSGYRRTGLVLVAQVPLIYMYTQATVFVAVLGGLGRLVGWRGSRDGGPASLARTARRFNDLGIAASLLVLLTIWTMFLARL